MSKLGLYVGNSFFSEDEDDVYFINISFNNLNQFYSLENNYFDIIVLDKCLQKFEEFNSVFENAKRLLKNSGELIIVLPDFRLYEKCNWPSRFNNSHLHTFSLDLTREIINRKSHWNIKDDLIENLKKFGFDLFDVILDDNDYNYDLPVLVDQTKNGASCFIILTCKILK